MGLDRTSAAVSISSLASRNQVRQPFPCSLLVELRLALLLSVGLLSRVPAVAKEPSVYLAHFPFGQASRTSVPKQHQVSEMADNYTEATTPKPVTAFDEANKAAARLIKPKAILYTSAFLSWTQPFQSG